MLPLEGVGDDTFCLDLAAPSTRLVGAEVDITFGLRVKSVSQPSTYDFGLILGPDLLLAALSARLLPFLQRPTVSHVSVLGEVHRAGTPYVVMKGPVRLQGGVRASSDKPANPDVGVWCGSVTVL